MNWLDVVIVLVVVAFVVMAFRAGLVREVVTLLSVIAGIVLGGLFYDNLARDIFVFLDEGTAGAVAFLMIFGCTYLFGQIVAYTLRATVSLLMLGWADRVGGAFFGLLKGLLVVEVLLIILAGYPGLGLDGAVADSAIAPLFVEDVDVVLWILPANFENRVDAFLGG